MQTFITRIGAYGSARDLDDQRLGKQRVEALQILQSLVNSEATGERQPWGSHPAVRMWKGHEYGLSIYTLCVCHEWQRRGYKDTVSVKVQSWLKNQSYIRDVDVRADHVFWEAFPIAQELAGGRSRVWPWWMRDRDVIRSHRSNLVRKVPGIYGPKFPGMDGSWPYLWPDSQQVNMVRVSHAESIRLKSGERTMPPGMELDWATLEVQRG